MQKGTHMGKIVVAMPEDPADLPSEAAYEALSLRDDGAYLFVGGLGGLGRSITTWLAEKGARHFVFLSRSAGNMPDDDPFIRELSSLGCTATRVSGDVSNYDDVVRAIKAAGRPINGVLQASMVLQVCASLLYFPPSFFPLSEHVQELTRVQDNNLEDMTWKQWMTASKPKIQGTWNLHNALIREQTQPVDHFFLFSSAGAVSGQWGQANYNAGNTFLDAFVSYRHSLGLAASTVNIGAIEDIGYLSANEEVLDSLRATATHIMREPELLDCIELMLKRSSPTRAPPTADGERQQRPSPSPFRYVQPSQIAIGLRSLLPIEAPHNRTIWRKDPRMLVYRNREATDHALGSAATTSSDEALSQFLRDIASNMTLLRSAEAVELITRELGTTLLGFLMRGEGELDLEAPLAAVGIDSLISIELRNWIRRRLGAEVTVLEIVRAESVRSLALTVQTKLVEKYQARG